MYRVKLECIAKRVGSRTRK